MDKWFLITIDTEGDNLWSCSDIKQEITTKNAGYLFRFQELCEKYGFIPTYLTNYEMAKDDAMKELGREGLKRNVLEIGAHEHAWNQPPYHPLIKRLGKRRGKPYLEEYPKTIIREKLAGLTGLLQDTFQCKIRSHRGGRWCLNAAIVDALVDLGYVVDCTCTPGVNWNDTPGWTMFSKGTNWSSYPGIPFYIGGGKNGNNHLRLLEIPVSIVDMKKSGHYSWLRPNLNNKWEMMALLDTINEGKFEYAEFMLHSSELMPGGSPWFNNKGKIEKLYSDLEDLFSYAKQLGFKGVGLTQYTEDKLQDKDRLRNIYIG